MADSARAANPSQLAAVASYPLEDQHKDDELAGEVAANVKRDANGGFTAGILARRMSQNGRLLTVMIPGLRRSLSRSNRNPFRDPAEQATRP